MYNDFITMETLATFAGLVVTVSIIVQFTKSLVKNRYGDAAVKVYTFIISLVLTFVFARNGQGIEGVILTAINSIIVAIAAMGAYENSVDPKAEKKK